MKTFLPIIFFLSFFTITIQAQNGGSALDVNSTQVMVPDNSNGTLDVNTVHTIEVWFNATEVISDQKLVSKISTDLLDGYILGIENGTVKYEVFDDNGSKTELIAGVIEAGRWIHLAATYNASGSMKLYINGVLTGEVANPVSTSDYNTNNLAIGTNSWGLGLLQFSGQIDEVHYWNAELSEETINDWMHRSATAANGITHPDIASLALYHKYNEGTGESAADDSTQGNSGTYTGGAWVASTVPFKDWPLFVNSGPAIGGVWPDHESYTLGNLTLSGSNLSGIKSATIESNVENISGSFCSTSGNTTVNSIGCLVWHISKQGDPTLNFSFDLSNFDLTNIETVVLLESTELSDLTNATAISGTITGNTFEVNSHTVADQSIFYFLGFVDTPPNSVKELENKLNFSIAPNPTNGQFQLQVENSNTETIQLNILDFSGKLILEKTWKEVANFQENFDLSYLPKGIYMIQLNTEKGISANKLVID